MEKTAPAGIFHIVEREKDRISLHAAGKYRHPSLLYAPSLSERADRFREKADLQELAALSGGRKPGRKDPGIPAQELRTGKADLVYEAEAQRRDLREYQRGCVPGKRGISDALRS